MISSRHILAASLLLSAAAPLGAQTVKEGADAWQRGDYPKAVAIWVPLATKGDAEAQFDLGQAYRLGRGVGTNLATAQAWFERAAEQGQVDAQTTLGLMLFQNGDQPNGLKWLRKAADQGEARAMLVYGTALFNGDGVPQDPTRGYAYVSRAAGLGLAQAKQTLDQLDQLLPASERKRGALLARELAKAAPADKQAATKPIETAAAKPPPKPAAKPVPKPALETTVPVAPKPDVEKAAVARSAGRLFPARKCGGALQETIREVGLRRPAALLRCGGPGHTAAGRAFRKQRRGSGGVQGSGSPLLPGSSEIIRP